MHGEMINNGPLTLSIIVIKFFILSVFVFTFTLCENFSSNFPPLDILEMKSRGRKSIMQINLVHSHSLKNIAVKCMGVNTQQIQSAQLPDFDVKPVAHTFGLM
jgi:hypothetical protein